MPDEEEKQEHNADDEAFYEKATSAFGQLFERAKARNKLEFAFSLSPEFRGAQGPGWSAADETRRALKEYEDFIRSDFTPGTFRVRVALSFYSHLAEASGYYEVPKNMMRVAEGQRWHMWPFLHFVRQHQMSGARIAPNSNKVFQDLMGHAETLGLSALAEVFRDVFEPDLRNAYAHADYVIWQDGLRLPKRNGGYPRRIRWDEFERLLNRGLRFFHILLGTISDHIRSYETPRVLRCRLGDEGPERDWTIRYESGTGAFSITG
jgi:hypothetical protein